MYLVTIDYLLQLHKELYEREPVIPGGVKQQQAVPQVPHLSYKQQGRILSLAIVNIITYSDVIALTQLSINTGY